MRERKPISKKIRFEVFKRDSFTCQYCGAKAPDVELEVDHIEPVSKGGDDNILNLVTACFDCNRGKFDRELDDDSIIARQRASAEELNKKRNQIEMMAQWVKDLQDLDDTEIDVLVEIIEENTGSDVTNTGRINLKKWINRYGLKAMIEAVYAAVNQYDDLEYAFTMMPKIAYYKANPDKQIPKEAFYARSILKNRLLHEFNGSYALKLILSAAENATYDDINSVIQSVDTWEEFYSAIRKLARG